MNEQIKKIKKLMGIKEQSSSTQLYFHGGDLNYLESTVQSKNNRIAYGIGLYLTTSRNVVEKYIKGSRKLYIVEVDNNITTFDDVTIPSETIYKVLMGLIPKSKFSLVKEFLQRRNTENINASLLNTFLLNNNLINNKNINDIMEFFFSFNIDGNIDISPFGWGEKQLTLINTKKIINIKQVKPSDKEYFDDFKY